MDANVGVEFGVASDVVADILASKKSWNVEIAGLESFDTLPADVKETAVEKYYSENAYGNGEVHNWSVGVLAQPGRDLVGQLIHQSKVVIVDSLADHTGRADDAGRASGQVLGGKVWFHNKGARHQFVTIVFGV